MRIKFGELHIGEKARANLLHCCDTNWATGGPKVREFEEKWGNLFGYRENIAMSSGTDAGINACAMLHDFGARRGDEIIVPALSFVASSNAVLAAGFMPVFVDIERETMNIDPTRIEAAITPRTRAIQVVHTMGKPCEMDMILAIAREHGLKVLEDACEAHGAKYRGDFVGSHSDAATFSYYVAHLICCGEGGMVSTNNPEVAAVLRSTRTHGRRDGKLYFDFVRLGFNSKMNDLEASLGLEAIDVFWETFTTRKKNLRYLMENCADLSEFAWFNQEEEHEVLCPHAFSITLKDPSLNFTRMYAYLEEHGIQCKLNFGSLPTQHETFAWIGHKIGDFPEAEYVGENGLHMGCHQFLTQDDLDFMVENIHNYFRNEV